MATVKLHGDLQRFGSQFELAVESTAEAIRGLCYQIQGLKRHLNNGLYKVRIGNRYLDNRDVGKGVHEKIGKHTVINIMPVLAGAKNGGMFQIIVGAILIAASWWAGGAAGWAYLGATGYGMATAAFMMGASMMLGGVSQMLTKTPSMDMKLSESEKKTNTSFSGIKNLTPQGRPVPLLYGEMMHSFVLISQGTEVYTPEE